MENQEEPKTYRDVGIFLGLERRTLERFVFYMKGRWESQEETQCKYLYAHEWGNRFKDDREYTASDFVGLTLLKRMDKQNENYICSACHRTMTGAEVIKGKCFSCNEDIEKVGIK